MRVGPVNGVVSTSVRGQDLEPVSLSFWNADEAAAPDR